MDTKRGTPFEQSWRGPSRRSPCIIPDGNANSKDNSRPRRVKKRELERRCTDRKKRVFAPLDKTRISAYTVEYKRSAVKGRTRLFWHRREGGRTIACAARPPVPMEWSGGRPGAPPRRAAAFPALRDESGAGISRAIWVVPRNLRPIIGTEVFLWKRKGRTNHAVDWSERIKGKISLFF